MKLNQKNKTFETDVEATQIRKFEIRQSAHTFRILSDSIYSDKPLAVIRELSSNAWDSHIAAGKTDTPFHIHLPNNVEPYFSITDFGVGLSEEDIYNLYCTYGGTNKDQTNDFVGGFGLGSKSPFAYTDQFTVTSRFEGEETTYNAFIAEDGTPQIMKTFSRPTLESNGLEIHVVVEPKDFSAFRDRATTIFSRYPVLPLIDGVADFKPKQVKYRIENDTFKFREEEKTWSSNSRAVAVQGLVAYPIDTGSFQSDLTRMQREVLNERFDIHFDIGDISMTASREQLNYDRDTEAAILAKVDKILEELPTLVQSDIDAAPNLWEALKVYNTWNKNSDMDSDLKRHIGKNLTYKNEPINEGKVEYKFFEPPKNDGDEIEIDAELKIYYTSTFKMKRITSETKHQGSIVPTDNWLFIYDDVGKRSFTSKVDYHFRGENINVALIQCDKSYLPEVKKRLGGVTIQKWSDYLEPPKQAKVPSGTKGVTIQKLLEFTTSNYHDNWIDANHNVEDGGFYTITYSREPVRPEANTDYGSHLDFRRTIESAKALGIIPEGTKIFGIQSTFKNIPKNYDGWIQIEDYIKAELKKRYSKVKLSRLMADHGSYNEAVSSDVRTLFNMLRDHPDAKFVSTRSPAYKLHKALGELEDLPAKHLESLLKYYGLYEINKVKPTNDFISLAKECVQRYPLLSSMGGYINPKKLKHYIDVCDSSPSLTLSEEV